MDENATEKRVNENPINNQKVDEIPTNNQSLDESTTNNQRRMEVLSTTQSKKMDSNQVKNTIEIEGEIYVTKMKMINLKRAVLK